MPSTKAAAAFGLSVLALVTAPFIGGIIPAVVALGLCSQADADLAESQGFLLGAARSRRARRLAYLALGITGLAVLILATWWIVRATANTVN